MRLGRKWHHLTAFGKPWPLAEILIPLIMNMRLACLTLVIQIFGLAVLGQKPTCKSLHIGAFKVSTKETGTTLIKRTEKIQIEKND